MEETSVVRGPGGVLIVKNSVLRKLGIQPGQIIDEPQMRQCIEGNIAAFVEDMDARRANGEDVPDMSNLRTSLRRRKSSEN